MTNLPRRFSILVLVASLLALVAIDTRLDVADRLQDEAAQRDVVDALAMPAASSDDSLGSTWYCAGGAATRDATADHTVVVTNPGDPLIGTLTMFPTYSDGLGQTVSGEPVIQQISVGGGSQLRVSLLEALSATDPSVQTAPETFIAAMLEFAEPGLIVEHAIQSPLGADVGPCASDPSDQWYFATGTTTEGAVEQLALLNPFSADAVVSITFATDDGLREPTALAGLVVPPRTLTVIDVGEENRARAQSSMMVELRAGRIVAERLQRFDTDEGLRGLSLALGASQPSLQWVFPAGRSIPGAGEAYVILNPSDEEADVEFLVKLDRGSAGVDSQPFSLTLNPRERVGVIVDPDDTLPVPSESVVSFGARLAGDEPYWVLVQSFNSVPIVVERVVAARGDEARGVLTGPGSPLASTEQWLVLPIELGATSPQVAVVNPANDTIARLEVQAIVDDALVDVTSVEIAPGGRIAADLSASLPVGSVALRLSSSTPVVSEVVVASPSGAVSTVGLPKADAVVAPRLVVDF